MPVSAADGAVRLFERAVFEAFVAGLPGTSLVYQWGDAAVAKVGGRIFALQRAGTPASLAFKCSDLAFELLPQLPGVVPAPYLSRAKWVAVGPEAPLSEAELAGYLREAHRLIVRNLPRRVRETLGPSA